MNPIFRAQNFLKRQATVVGIPITRMIVVDGDYVDFAPNAVITFDDALGHSEYSIFKMVGEPPFHTVGCTYRSGVNRGAYPVLATGCSITVHGLSAGDGSGRNDLDGYTILMSGTTFYANLPGYPYNVDPSFLVSRGARLGSAGTLILSCLLSTDVHIGNNLGINGSFPDAILDVENFVIPQLSYLWSSGRPIIISGIGTNMPVYFNVFWENRSVVLILNDRSSDLDIVACPFPMWFNWPIQTCDWPWE